jgi:hypothetical protein
MALPANPNLLASVLAKIAPVNKDQFAGNDFPGSYLWRKGDQDSQQFQDQRQAKIGGAAKLPKIQPIVRPTLHLPAIGKTHV